MKLDTNNHSVFKLEYHLILCINKGYKVIDSTVADRLKSIFEDLAPNYNITLINWKPDNNNIQILFKGQPNTEISKFINAYKSASSRHIKNEVPSICKSLWRDTFWSQSFCLISTGEITQDIIDNYINRQTITEDK